MRIARDDREARDAAALRGVSMSTADTGAATRAALEAAGEAGADADDDPGRRPFAGLAALLGRRDVPPTTKAA